MPQLCRSPPYPFLAMKLKNEVFDPINNHIIEKLERLNIYPAMFVTSPDVYKTLLRIYKMI